MKDNANSNENTEDDKIDEINGEGSQRCYKLSATETNHLLVYTEMSEKQDTSVVIASVVSKESVIDRNDYIVAEFETVSEADRAAKAFIELFSSEFYSETDEKMKIDQQLVFKAIEEFTEEGWFSGVFSSFW